MLHRAASSPPIPSCADTATFSTLTTPEHPALVGTYRVELPREEGRSLQDLVGTLEFPALPRQLTNPLRIAVVVSRTLPGHRSRPTAPTTAPSRASPRSSPQSTASQPTPTGTRPDAPTPDEQPAHAPHADAHDVMTRPSSSLMDQSLHHPGAVRTEPTFLQSQERSSLPVVGLMNSAQYPA
jgi:hypothetical protein